MDFNRILLSVRIRTKEFPRRTLQDTSVLEKNNWKIPNICYQTWVNHKFGRSHYAEVQNFRKLNSDIAFKLFDDESLNSYMLRNWSHHPIYQIFLDSKFGPMRADIFRYCILYERGGYYFDISKGCKVSIRSMHNSQTEAFISFENNQHGWEIPNSVRERLTYPDNLIIQWGFGFIEKHPILEGIINRIVENEVNFRQKTFNTPKDAILRFTGPQSFTKSVHEVIAELPNKTIEQAGIDFFGHGIYALKGSYVRYFTKKHYTEFSNSTIL